MERERKRERFCYIAILCKQLNKMDGINFNTVCC